MQYFLRANGNNSNPTTIDGAYHPVGLSNLWNANIQAGDEILVLDTDGPLDRLHIDGGGNENAWITIQPYEDHKPVFDGKNQNIAFLIKEDTPYIRISNLKFINSSTDGFRSYFSDNLEIINCESSGNRKHGFDIRGNDFLIKSCKANLNGACGVFFKGYDGLLSGCSFIANGSNVAQYPYTAGARCCAEFDSQRLMIENCTAIGNRVGLWLDSVSTFCSMQNNLVYGNSVAGLFAEASDGILICGNESNENGVGIRLSTDLDEPIKNCVVIGNKCTKNATGIWCYGKYQATELSIFDNQIIGNSVLESINDSLKLQNGADNTIGPDGQGTGNAYVHNTLE